MRHNVLLRVRVKITEALTQRGGINFEEGHFLYIGKGTRPVCNRMKPTRNGMKRDGTKLTGEKKLNYFSRNFDISNRAVKTPSLIGK